MYNILIFLFLATDGPLQFVFLAPFLSFFSALLLAFPFAFHILSGCRKELGVNYGQSLEMGT